MVTFFSEACAARVVAVFSTPTMRSPGLSTSARLWIAEPAGTRNVLCSTMWGGPKSTFFWRSLSTGRNATSHAPLATASVSAPELGYGTHCTGTPSFFASSRPRSPPAPRGSPLASIATLPAPGLGATAMPTRSFPVGANSLSAAGSAASAPPAVSTTVATDGRRRPLPNSSPCPPRLLSALHRSRRTKRSPAESGASFDRA